MIALFADPDSRPVPHTCRKGPVRFPRSAAPRTRRAAPWYEEGQEPDHRFSLASERTFLAHSGHSHQDRKSVV